MLLWKNSNYVIRTNTTHECILFSFQPSLKSLTNSFVTNHYNGNNNNLLCKYVHRDSVSPYIRILKNLLNFLKAKQNSFLHFFKKIQFLHPQIVERQSIIRKWQIQEPVTQSKFLNEPLIHISYKIFVQNLECKVEAAK